MRRNFEKTFYKIFTKFLKSNFSPVDSGNGTHDSDSGDGSDKDFVMDENSSEDSDLEGEKRKKKKNVKTGKNTGHPNDKFEEIWFKAAKKDVR